MVRVFEKQKYINVRNEKKPLYRECSGCGSFTKTSTKRLTYWDRFCFVCGVGF